VNCVEGGLIIEGKLHPTFDVALLTFKDYKRLLCDKFPMFAKDGTELQQGTFLCRIGFPFPEFTNFEYDKVNDRIRWTDKGRINTPRFPIEGMVTRRLVRGDVRWGFELSTPGLKGQSGGPAFDTDGRIWDMQSGTNHLDLQFDVNKDLFRCGRKVHVTEHAFLHVGHCVDINTLKASCALIRLSLWNGEARGVGNFVSPSVSPGRVKIGKLLITRAQHKNCSIDCK